MSVPPELRVTDRDVDLSRRSHHAIIVCPACHGLGVHEGRGVVDDVLAEIEPAIAEASQRGMGMHVTYTGAFASVARLPSVRRDLDRLAATIRAALKETP